MAKKKSKHPLRQIREAISEQIEMSQEALAELVGCSRETINRIELGRLKLSDEMAYRIDEVLGSSLRKWLDGGQGQFILSKDKLHRNYAIIRTRRGGSIPSKAAIEERSLGVSRDTLSQAGSESGVDLTELYDAADNAIEEFPRLLRETLVTRGCNQVWAERFANQFGKVMEIREFCDYEIGVFRELATTALEQDKYLPFLWEFSDWVEKTNEKLGLGLREPAAFILNDVASGTLLEAVDSMSPAELEKLGIARIVKKNVTDAEIEAMEIKPDYWSKSGNAEEGVYDEVYWFEGLHAN